VNAAKALDYLCRCLEDQSFYATPQSLDPVDGGTFSFTIDAGRENAGKPYLLLGSASGTSPASMIGATPFPLVVDAYTRFSLLHANELPLAGNLGLLDDRGRAVVSLILPPVLAASLAGSSVHHAAAVWVDGVPRPMHVPATLVTQPRTVQLRLPPRILFSEDFEQGLSGWSVVSDGAAAWHLAEDGECGATTRMAAFNEAASCSFTPETLTSSRLISPSFVLSDVSPFTIEFDMVRDFAAESLSSVKIEIVDESTVNPLVTQTIPGFLIVDQDSGGLVNVRLQVPQSSKFEKRSVHVEFISTSKEPAAGNGWLVDNVVIRDLGALPDGSGP
jgi:hypothetical protein